MSSFLEDEVGSSASISFSTGREALHEREGFWEAEAEQDWCNLGREREGVEYVAS